MTDALSGPFPSAARRFIGALPPLMIAIIALLIAASPATTEALQFDRAKIVVGQWHRLLTCHLTHFGASHLAWDVAVFVVQAMLATMIDARRTAATLALAGIVIPLGVLLCLPALQTYRGLSGIDSALFVLLAILVLRRSLTHHRRSMTGVTLLCLVAFGTKTAFECLTSQTLFVKPSEHFTPVPLAHMIGAACGAIMGAGAR